MQTEVESLKLFFIGIITSVLLIFGLSNIGIRNDVLYILLFVLISTSIIIIFLSLKWCYILRILAIVFSILVISLIVPVLFPPCYLIIEPEYINESFNDETNWPPNASHRISITNLGMDLNDINLRYNGTNEDIISQITIEPRAIAEINTGEVIFIIINFSMDRIPKAYNGRITIANDKFNRSIPIDISVNLKSDAGSLNKKGEALLDLGLYREAIESFDDAIEINSSLADSWIGRSEALSRLGKFEDAKISYERALREDPQNGEILHHQSILLRAMGQGSNAEIAMKKANDLGFST